MIMIELHGWMTPNSRKLYYLLEDTDLEYRIHPVNIGQDEQFKPEFLKISPNNKTPALVDLDAAGGEPHAVFETSAMLIYLAEKAGRYLPEDPIKRSVTLQWLMWQTGGVSPMFGQAGHFRGLDDQDGNAYAVERFTTEANRLFGVLDRRLTQTEFLAGDDYTIADISTHPWMRMPARQGVEGDNYPNFKRWFDRINERPAVQRANKIADSVRDAAGAASGSIDPASLV
jgi:GSH-dependent disulfide-bond oxidoreductase